VTFAVEIERDSDGRWLAEVPTWSGVMASMAKAGTKPSLSCRLSPFE
jgi:predicted RNase H-like HicB family nuclease